MNKPIHSEVYKGYTIQIHADEDPLNPRTDYDCLGTMVCFHKRYDLGDKHTISHSDYAGWDEMEEAIRKDLDAVVVLPLYLYDHGGITMSTGQFSCRWDSGQVGFIYATREKVFKEFGRKDLAKAIERATKVLEGEVETYDHYLRGDVYGYTLYAPGDEDLDDSIESCWGYLGDYDDKDYGALSEAKSLVDNILARELEARMKSSLAMTGMEE